MSYRLRFTRKAGEDLDRLFEFLADRDLAAAERAMTAISRAWTILEDFPFSCREAVPNQPLLRELPISFGRSGYLALFEIDGPDTVTVLAVRHQREDDYGEPRP